jgi:type III restriction enzyme
MLKHSDNTISRRQEVGRGLRLAVDKNGDRIDHPSVVHEINVLTVVASESYKAFVGGLQKEISETLTARPRKADEAYFKGKVLEVGDQKVAVTEAMAKKIYFYLVKNEYVDEDASITQAYHDAKEKQTLADLPADLAPHKDQILGLIDSVFDESKLPKVEDGRKPKTNPLNANFKKKEFQELWSRINKKAVYRVEFESDELIVKAVNALDKQLRVTPLQYTVHTGEQLAEVTDEQLKSGDGFKVTRTSTEAGGSVHSMVEYDLVGKIAEDVHLTRKTVAEILTRISPPIFEQFRQNPEHFIAEASRLIREQKATAIIEKLQYDEVEQRYETDIFTAAQTGQDFSRATDKLKNHIYDYCMTDSGNERRFVEELDASSEVIVYAKLPRGFLIPTPVGDYNPDWAISFKKGSVKHIYFVAETKGSMSSMKLREIERTKIDCARKFFSEVNENIAADKVKYDVVTDFAKLMDVVGVGMT